MNWRLLSLTAVCSLLSAQPTRLQSVTKAPGEDVTLQIMASSDRSRAPVTLKWELSFPAQLLDFESATTGSAGTGSGKSLLCTARKQYSYSCSLTGGQHPIPDGPIAVYRFKVRATAPPSTTKLRIENAEATTGDSKKWQLEAIEATVVIR